jgi:TRAP-type C4-dicarboxylate transport system permease large subunit
MSVREIWDAAREAGMVVTPILLLLLGAAMYSKLLALAGIPQLVGTFFDAMQLGPAGIILVMCAIWLLLGCFVDSISIMLLTVPLFWPVAQATGIDPIVFALVGILVIEAGVLTPPFGIGAFVVLSAIPDRDLRLTEVFVGLAPYWIMILIVALAVYCIPSLATFVPSLM